MLALATLKDISLSKCEDAEALFVASRFDGAIYLCGYAVEIAIKYKICQTLKWEGFPETGSEFSHFQCLKTHNLDVLLRFTGFENELKGNHFHEWNVVAQWDPQVRYKDVGKASKEDAKAMVEAARKLVKELIK